MKILQLTLVLHLLLLTSCFEIKERFEFEKGGSGSYQLTFDLSSIQQYLQVKDSAKQEAYRLRLIDIEKSIRHGVQRLKELKGINDVEVQIDKEGFIFGYSYRFDGIDALNGALIKTNSKSFLKTFQLPFREKGRRKIQIQPIFQPETLLQDIIPFERGDQIPSHITPYLDQAYRQMNYTRQIVVPKKIKRHINSSYRLSKDERTLVLKIQGKDLIEAPSHLSERIKFK